MSWMCRLIRRRRWRCGYISSTCPPGAPGGRAACADLSERRAGLVTVDACRRCEASFRFGPTPDWIAGGVLR